MQNKNKSTSGCGIFVAVTLALYGLLAISALFGEVAGYWVIALLPSLILTFLIKAYLDLDERLTANLQTIADLQARLAQLEQSTDRTDTQA